MSESIPIYDAAFKVPILTSQFTFHKSGDAALDPCFQIKHAINLHRTQMMAADRRFPLWGIVIDVLEKLDFREKSRLYRIVKSVSSCSGAG